MLYVRTADTGLYYKRGEGFVKDKAQATVFPNIVDADRVKRDTYQTSIVNERDQPVMGMRVGRGMPVPIVIGGAV